MCNGTATQVYVDNTTAGGGWESFASAANSGNWPGLNTGNAVGWENLDFSYGTYNSSGSTGNYWRNITGCGYQEILFRTGNGTYWMVASIDSFRNDGSTTVFKNINTSGNFGSTADANTTYTVMHRTGNSEDPWVNVGDGHGSTSYWFWGENHSAYLTFKNNNGGILVLGRRSGG